jgi:hypothetical protein
MIWVSNSMNESCQWSNGVEEGNGNQSEINTSARGQRSQIRPQIRPQLHNSLEKHKDIDIVYGLQSGPLSNSCNLSMQNKQRIQILINCGWTEIQNILNTGYDSSYKRYLHHKITNINMQENERI